MDNNYEQEIDLKELIVYVLRFWRVIFLAGCIFAMLFGGYKALGVFKQQNNAEVMKKIEEENKADVELFKDTKRAMEIEISNIKKSIEEHEEYMRQSVAMQLNPYNVQYASADIYIDDLESKSDSIIQAYNLVLQNGKIIEEVSTQVGMERVYLQELVSVDNRFNYNENKKSQQIIDEKRDINSYYNGNLLHLTVCATDIKQAEIIRDGILKLLQDETFKEINTKIGPHKMSVLNQSSGTSINLDLKAKQDIVSHEIGELALALEEKNTDLEGLKAVPNVTVGTSVIVKTGIKYALIGGVLAVFCIAFFLCINFLISNKIHSGKEIKDRFNIKILGEVPLQKKRMFAFIDNWIDKLMGFDEAIAIEQMYEIMAAHINNYRQGANKILVTGSVDDGTLECIAKELHKHVPACNFETGGTMMLNAQVISGIVDCEGVILVEQKNETKVEVLKNEVDVIHDIGKRIVGCIII